MLIRKHRTITTSCSCVCLHIHLSRCLQRKPPWRYSLIPQKFILLSSDWSQHLQTVFRMICLMVNVLTTLLLGWIVSETYPGVTDPLSTRHPAIFIINILHTCFRFLKREAVLYFLCVFPGSWLYGLLDMFFFRSVHWLYSGYKKIIIPSSNLSSPLQGTHINRHMW